MKKTFFVRAMICIVACLLLISSCINDKYEMSEENLDLNVNVFKEGLILPLGNTDPVTLKYILEKAGLEDELKQYLQSEEGTGIYSIRYAPDEPLDLSENLSSLNGLVDIGKIDFSRSIDFSLKNIDVSKISYEGKEIPASVPLDEYLGGVKMPSSIPVKNHEFSIETALGEFADQLDNLDWSLNLGGGTSVDSEQMGGEFVLASVPKDFSIPDMLSTSFNLQDVNVALDLLKKPTIGLTEVIDKFNETVSLVHELPAPEITSVSKLHVKKGSKVKVSVSIINPFFTEGEITPHLDMDLGNLFHLTEDGERVKDDEIHEDFKLNHTNGWFADDEFEIEEIVLKENDWTTVENAKGEKVLQLNKTVDVSISGELHGLEDLTTTTAELQKWLDDDKNDHDGDGCKDVDVLVTIEFVEFELDDITMTFDPISIGQQEKTFDIPVQSFTFPKEVKDINDLKFEDSAIDIKLSADLSAMGDVGFEITELAITFPEEFEVDGTDNSNTVHLQNVGNLKDGPLTRSFKVLGFDMADPADGIVPEYKGEVKVVATGAVGGTVNTADLKDNIEINGSVTAELKVGDYNVVLEEIVKDSEDDPDMFPTEPLRIPVPEELADVQGMFVYLKDDPVIVIDIEMPELSVPLCPLERDLKIYVPEMIQFKESPDVKKYYSDGVITLPAGEPFPDRLEFPVMGISVSPVKDNEEYCLLGEFRVDGVFGIQEGTQLTKTDIDVLTEPETEIGFTATIPALEPDAVNMSSYTTSVTENFSFEPFKEVELPEMLKAVDRIELDDVYLSLALNTGKDFPNIGNDARLSAKIEVSLPDFITLEEDDPRCQDGKLVIEGELQDGVISVDPVKIASLELGKTREEISKLSETIGITGSVSLAGASLQVEDWIGKEHTVDVIADIKTIKEEAPENGKLGIKKITGNVGYAIDPIDMKVDLTQLSDYIDTDNLSATVDLSSFYLVMEVSTNLGVPAIAEMSITPYYGEMPGQTETRSISLEPSPSSQETRTSRFYVSDTDPEDQDYTFVNLDIFSMLYKDESKTELIDSIKVSLNARTDDKQTIIYEPSAEYTLTVDYAAGVPLSFEKDFIIEYKDTIPDIPAEYISLLNYGSVGLGGAVESSLPFNLDFQVNMLDSEDKVVPLAEGAGRQKIKSCDISGNPVVTPLEILLAKDKDVDVSDVKALEIVVTADTKDAAGVPLKEDSYLKIILNALIPEGGLSLDLKELIEEQGKDNESEEQENE